MWFMIFIFFCSVLIPLLTIIFSRSMRKHPPKNINGVCGYRTTMSMKNKDTWLFAHETCGKLWWKVGWVMLTASIIIASIAVALTIMKDNDNIVGLTGVLLCILQLVALIATISPVEKALKRNFNEDGTKKQA